MLAVALCNVEQLYIGGVALHVLSEHAHVVHQVLPGHTGGIRPFREVLRTGLSLASSTLLSSSSAFQQALKLQDLM